jgi:hypothetical protein
VRLDSWEFLSDWHGPPQLRLPGAEQYDVSARRIALSCLAPHYQIMSDFWDSNPAVDVLRGEGNLEHRLALPLLHALRYEDHEIDSKLLTIVS